MVPDPIGSLPAWLLVGVALGVLLALVAAAVFLVGVRRYPDAGRPGRGPEGGEQRRRAEIRQYLAGIGEPYREDHPVGGLRAAFYLPEREVAITFDARDYFRFERAGIQAVLAEYELPGSHLGSRLPFETPEREPEGGGGRPGSASAWRRRVRAENGSSTASAFAALGLPTTASEADVRAAYRDRVKEVHPDHGGDFESFRKLREAYTVARERAE